MDTLRLVNINNSILIGCQAAERFMWLDGIVFFYLQLRYFSDFVQAAEQVDVEHIFLVGVVEALNA